MTADLNSTIIPHFGCITHIILYLKKKIRKLTNKTTIQINQRYAIFFGGFRYNCSTEIEEKNICRVSSYTFQSKEAGNGNHINISIKSDLSFNFV